MATFKVAILEQNGVEFDISVEKDAAEMLLELGFLAPEFESFTDDPEESTTSNDWVTKNNYPYTTDTKDQGTYKIDFTCIIKQSDKEKKAGSRIQFREGTSGTWITLFTSSSGVTVDDETVARTSFRLITLSTDTDFQLRWQFGDTDDGGTVSISNAAISIGKVSV